MFVARCAIGWVGAVLLVALVPEIDRWAIRTTVTSLSLLLHLVRVPVVVAGAVVQLEGTTAINIVPDCTSLTPTLVLWCAIGSFPASLRWKMIGALAGAALTWAFNLLRILLLMAILGWRPIIFNFVHIYVWQPVTLVFVCGLFSGWLWLQRQPQVAT
jgi:exosortase/archaeosortase family protein